MEIRSDAVISTFVPASILTVAPASSSIAEAFTSTNVDASLPTVIVRPVALVPILIGDASG